MDHRCGWILVGLSTINNDRTRRRTDANAHQCPYEQPRAAQPTCESSSSRLDQLEERFNRLYARVNTLQDSITQQTNILEKISGKLDALEKR